MDLMELINNWKKISGVNSPMLPGQPPQATPPFVPQPGQGGYQPQQASSPFGQKSPLQPITTPSREKVGIDSMLPQVGTPERQKVGIDSMLKPAKAGSAYSGQLENITAPTRDRKSGIAEQKWYKDGDFMNELGGRLGSAFGSLTLRGNSPGEEKANMLKIAGAQENRKKNKTMDYLTKNNPEMAQKLMGLPPEMREQYMQLAMKSQFAGADESAFAEKVRMTMNANPDMSQADAINAVQSSGGTRISMNMGGGAGPFEEKLGEKTAEWMSGRRITSGQNRAEAGIVIDRLEQAVANGESVTGDWSSYLPDSARNLFGAEGLELQQDVERIVQQSLKETLGAQFAQKEAEQLFARTWNPKASPKVNLRRTRRLMDELDAYAANMDGLTEGMISSNGNMMKFLQDNPELAGAYTANSIYGIEYDDGFESGTPVPMPDGMDQATWDAMEDSDRELFR